jgi:hypothetical protein
MTPDLTNTADVDPEGWLTELDRISLAFMDRWEANPDSIPARNLAEVVHAAKTLIKRMQDAMEAE